MADKVKDMMGRMGKGPSGLTTGLKFLIGAGALAYGIKESIYTGKLYTVLVSTPYITCHIHFLSRTDQSLN